MVENLVVSEVESALLASLDRQLQQVRDWVRGVVEGLLTGMYVWGDGGISKSFTVTEALGRLATPHRVTNTHLTGRALFELLRDFPDHVHVIEDAETLFRDKVSLNLLQSASWGVGERAITWNTNRNRDVAFFTGGVILVSNRPLGNSPEEQALATRLTVAHLQPTDEELAAKVRQIARQGYQKNGRALSPAQCLEVADAIIPRCHNLQRKLNLRLLVNALNDRLLWESGASVTHWLDLLDSRMKERVVVTPQREPAAVRRAGEREFARTIAHLPTLERLSLWKKETGKSQATLYRCLEPIS